jgi:hypothetical protein
MKDSEVLFTAIHRYLSPKRLRFDDQLTKTNFVCICVWWLHDESEVSEAQASRVVKFIESFLKNEEGLVSTFTGYPPHGLLENGELTCPPGEIQMLRYMWALNLVELLKIEEAV